jgi:hypothetical protein
MPSDIFNLKLYTYIGPPVWCKVQPVMSEKSRSTKHALQASNAKRLPERSASRQCMPRNVKILLFDIYGMAIPSVHEIQC